MSQAALRNLVVFITSRSWRDLLDITVVTVLFYRLLILVRGTRAVQLTFGLGLLVLVGLAAKVLNLQLTYFIFSNLAPALLIGIVILFQPELRRALDRVGRVGFLGRPLAHYNLQLMSRVVDEVVQAAQSLGEQRIGALIVFERTVGLENYALTGVRVGADVTTELLQTLFFPRSPLHDGAVIIRGNRLVAAGCLLPVSDELNISGRIGTRHRAALAMSVESDALVVVVSEESGRISVVQDGNLHRGVDPEALRQVLHNELLPKQEVSLPWLRPRQASRGREAAALSASLPARPLPKTAVATAHATPELPSDGTAWIAPDPAHVEHETVL